MIKQSLLTFLAISLTFALAAQVVINEYSASNLKKFKDSFGKTEDWIELYNTSNTAVDISGWHLSDKENKPTKWEIPAGTIIPANGFLVFLCSGRDLVKDGEYHTNFKLTQTKGKDGVLLANQNGDIQEYYPLALTLVEHSRCRATDGGMDWMISTEPSFGTSNNETPKVKDYTAVPTMSLAAGFYNSAQTVSITNNEPNSMLRYTIDGSNPTATSPLYTTPLTITKTQVIKARAFSNDPMNLPGKMGFNTYFIGEEYSLAVFSVAADRVIDLANGNGFLLPVGSIEYFTTEKERAATSFGSLNRHGQDSWVLDHRSLDWISRDEMGYSKAVEAPLFSYSEREEYQKFMFRNSGDDNYPAIEDEDHQGSTHVRDEYVQKLAQEGGLELDVRAVERVVLFLNGEYWGVYGMREKVVDHDFTKEYYDQGKYDIQYLSTWETTEIEYGGLQALEDWTKLRDFILDNDMSVPENYQIAEDSINMTSLIDYFLMNQGTVASDWLNYNTGWWRGLNPEGKHKKWGYILWDLDATFDYYINYTGIPNQQADAALCDIYPISDAIDIFFSGVDSLPTNFEDCPAIRNGSSPYPTTDSIFQLTIATDFFCCAEWDEVCEDLYTSIKNGEDIGGEIVNPADCPSIINGSSPYPATDSIFQIVVNADEFCCNEWDEACQQFYESIADGNGGGISPRDCPILTNGNAPYPITDPIFLQVLDFNPDCCEVWGEICQSDYRLIRSGGEEIDTSGLTNIPGNVGQHEKILLKLFQENPDFKQLYYSRFADLMNTVFSCDNMNALLDKMVAKIEPEMPRQIARWGGTMDEWALNVDTLRMFVNDRCAFLNQEAMACHGELSGQYNLTLMTRPEGIGEIDLNTLDIETFPWNGEYYGGMSNKIKAKVFNDFEEEYEFSHWESATGNVISPTVNDRKANLTLTQADTLTAVFRLIGTTSTEELVANYGVAVFPNPASSHLLVNLDLPETTNISAELFSITGQKIANLPTANNRIRAGQHTLNLPLNHLTIADGLYFLKVQIGEKEGSFKVNVIR